MSRMSTNSHAETASLSSGSSQQKQLTNELVQIAAPSKSLNDMHHRSSAKSILCHCGSVQCGLH